MKHINYIVLGIFFGLVVGALSASMMQQTLNDNNNKPQSFAEAVNLAAPSVVNIYTTRIIAASQNTARHILSNNLNNKKQKSRYEQKVGLGSGVIINNRGFILTNNHVIQDAQEILVLLYDGREALAQVIGVDKETDLAVLKIDLSALQAINIGSLENAQVGDHVLAIGNPYGFGQTVTAGIISAKGRYGLNRTTYENFIQTDAAINEGNSGGALINNGGELIGINAINYTQAGGSLGIGLAIPIDIAAKVMTDIIRHGQVIRGWLGLEVRQLTPSINRRLGLSLRSGVVVTNTTRHGPAEQAGIQPDDIIISINGIQIDNGQTGLLEVANLEPGKIIDVEITRNQQTMIMPVTVGVRPQPRISLR